MKLMISIGIGFLFLMVGQLNLSDTFNLGTLSLFGVDDLGSANFSWIQGMVSKFLIFPDMINTKNDEILFNFINKYFSISLTQIYLAIIFVFYFLFTLFPLLLSNKFRLDRDKKSFIILYIFVYSAILFFIK